MSIRKHVAFVLAGLPAGGRRLRIREDAGRIERKPVAAAVLTLSQRDDGHVMLFHETVSAIDETQFPLPWLVDRALIPGAPAIVTPVDAATLAIAAMERRFWAEPRLAGLTGGLSLVDPTRPGGIGVADETGLCRRLGIPLTPVTDIDIGQGWARHTPEPAIAAALGVAVARLMLWAHGASFAAASPEPFFETLLPLAAWLADEAERVPSLDPLLRSRPNRRATSFAGYYRDYRLAGDAGDAGAAWVTFEDGLFHT